MNTVKLNVARDKSFVAAGMSYRIFINEKEVAKLRIGKVFYCQIPKERLVLRIAMVGNALSFHKMVKEVIIFPECSTAGVVNCKVRTKLNLIGLLTGGLFQTIGRIEVDVSYC